jgi:hypothetical protein
VDYRQDTLRWLTVPPVVPGTDPSRASPSTSSGTEFTVYLGDIDLSEQESADIRSEIVTVIVQHLQHMGDAAPNEAYLEDKTVEAYRRNRPRTYPA